KDDIRKILGPPQRSRSKKERDLPLLDVKIEEGSQMPDRPGVLFLDEIHRFNKAQQDFLLPHVESGELVLIGATTENPSFEVISALLSRMRVFTLSELTDEDMSEIIDRTGLEMSAEAKQWLIEMANGDARQAI